MYKKLEMLMTANGFTRKTLAESLGISYEALCNKLKGKTQFTVDEMFAIKKALRTTLTIDELLS